MKDFENRLFLEFSELDERFRKLTAFLENDENKEKREAIDEKHLAMMYYQHSGMQVYRNALMDRINDLGFLEYPLVNVGEIITTDKDEVLRCTAVDPVSFEPLFEKVSTL